ncbi:hypothetical protein MKK88_01095 [Methylobacterium sp. E-005]|uniref:hypothetical protein n=1 Tax=Methylobacterium sp. E-005 TaxID=2836549 RepID=UPI001FB9D635|nr:hypothetical protein [Methylobacterium sp. E-005]MCJ2084592.1 hypothetical protein [Methylobacterium sp. E-005]
MPTDVVILGPVEFDAWSSPEKLPFGGRQQISAKKLPGGDRVIDAMGPDDIDRAWTGKFWGDDAIDQALLLDSLRKSGTPLPYSNGVEARTVIILEFLPLVCKATYVEFSIILMPVDSSAAGGGGFGAGIGGPGIGLGIGGIGLPTLDVTVGADLSVSVGLIL